MDGIGSKVDDCFVLFEGILELRQTSLTIERFKFTMRRFLFLLYTKNNEPSKRLVFIVLAFYQILCTFGNHAVLPNVERNGSGRGSKRFE